MNDENPQLQEALREALAAAHLEGFFDTAKAWCKENGAWELEELAAPDVFPDFAKDINLKRLEAKRLLQIFSSSGDQEDGSPVGTVHHLEPSFSSSFSAFSGPQSGVVVRNTFIDDVRPTAAELGGNRSQTVPITGRQVSEDEDEDDAVDAEDGADADSTGRDAPGSPIPVVSANLLTCKTQTFDQWEPQSYWEQAFTDIKGDAESDKVPETGRADPASSSASVPPPAGLVYMPPQMWGMPMMGYPMMPQMAPMMDAAAAHSQMQMGGMMGMAAPMEALNKPAAAPKPRSQVMERAFSMHSQCERFRWTVDSRKLKSSDREAVSPTFEVSCGDIIHFKMVLKPKVMDSQKGGACFKRSRNKGYIELRCVTDLEQAGPTVKPTLTFRLQVASARRQEHFRGPVRHNFADRAICGLPEGQDEWDFGKVVDHNNSTFGIVLEVLKDE